MSDHESSYYEIALTNRQVVVAFVILLVCLLGSFFAGLWVGRGEVEAAVGAPAEQQARADGGVEELPFFSGGELDSGGDAAAAEPAAPRRTPPTPAEDPAALRARREARERARKEAAAAEATGPDLAGGEGPALGAEAPPATPPASRKPAAPAPREAPAAAAPAAGAPAAAGPVIQVLSTRDRAVAQKTLDRLRAGGERVFLSPVEVSGQTMFRVRLGPFADRAAAEKVAARVRRTYRLDTWITQ